VHMGHGVVRHALAGLKSARVAGLGAVFFATAEALEVSENVGTVSDHSSSLMRRLFLVLPLAVLNAVFVYWIFSSLSKTLNKLKVRISAVLAFHFGFLFLQHENKSNFWSLQAKRMTTKLEMYRMLNNALIIAVAVSLSWITFEVNTSAKQTLLSFLFCEQEHEFIQLHLLYKPQSFTKHVPDWVEHYIALVLTHPAKQSTLLLFLCILA
jgi:hypothetical protein